MGQRRLCKRDRDLKAGSLVDGPRAEGTHHRRLLLWRLQLDEAEHARCAAVVDQPEFMDWAVGLAEIEHGLGKRVEVSRPTERIEHLGFHPDDAKKRQGVRLSSKT